MVIYCPKVHMDNISYITCGLSLTDSVIVLGDFNLINIIWCWSEDEKGLMPRYLHFDCIYFLLSTWYLLFFCEYLLVYCLFSLNLSQINNVKNNLGRILNIFFVGSNINGVLSITGYPFYVTPCITLLCNAKNMAYKILKN